MPCRTCMDIPWNRKNTIHILIIRIDLYPVKKRNAVLNYLLNLTHHSPAERHQGKFH